MALKAKVSGGLWGLLRGTVTWTSSSQARLDMTKLYKTLNDHTALYEEHDVEEAGPVADSISRLRRKLQRFKTKDPYVLESAANFQSACGTFQNRVQNLSRQYYKTRNAIYKKNLNIMDLKPPIVGYEFAVYLGMFRAEVGEILKATSRESSVAILGGLKKLV